jgi:CubicO group peptidase (beta-lactamase class C family)
MMLVERGRLGLDDRVAEYVPEFAAEGKDEVRVRHLMTHTSGLPDMLPENETLRAGNRPLSDFVAGTCRHPLLFPPGTRVRYQSMGTLMLAEVVVRITGGAIAGFLERELFGPLGMRDTSLGARPETLDRIARVRLSPEQEAASGWNWNSRYWRELGSPWGGLITTPGDLARFCQLFLGEGAVGKTRLLALATVRAMTANQLAGMPAVPEEDRRCRPWGLGWRLAWPGHSSNFGDLLGPRTFGHWGATGTLFWADPDAEGFCVLLTTEPQRDDGRLLARASNAVAAALA